MSLRLSLVALSLLLTACASPRPASSATASPQPSPTIPASTPTPLPPTRTSTATSTPSQTPFPSPTPTPTLALITPSPSPAPNTGRSFLSPDGQWTASISVTEINSPTGEPTGNHHTLFKLAPADGSAEWVLADETWHGLGASVPQGVRCSVDSRYFYFYWQTLTDGSCIFFENSGLQRADPRARRVSPLDVGASPSLSPTDQRIAYIDYQPAATLVLRELATNQEQRWPLELEAPAGRTMRAGGIVWRSDEHALVLTIAFGSFCEPQLPTHMLLRIDIDAAAGFKETPLLSEQNALIEAVEWPAGDKLLVRSSFTGATWWIDALTGQPSTAPS